MSTEVAFDVPSFINSRTTGITQYGIVLLCGLVMFLDGFDTQAISYMAPSIRKGVGAHQAASRTDLFVGPDWIDGGLSARLALF
ncbi:hypothetical protein ACVWZZ_003328 [Bradyrhizobium sp. LM6.10]